MGIRRGKKRLNLVEGLESRAMLAGDSAIAGSMPGDADLNGQFESTDFVQVFQFGKFETGEVANWGQGDWNGDGVFSTSDLVYAFQQSHYETSILAAGDGSDDVEGEVDDAGDDVIVDEDGTVDDDDSDADVNIKHRHRHHQGALSVDRIQSIVDRLSEQLASEDPQLPGNLTVDQATAIVEGLNAALATDDPVAAAEEFLSSLREAKQVERLQILVDNLNAAIDSGELPNGLTQEEVATIVTGLNAAIESGDFTGLGELLSPLRGANGHHHDDEDDGDSDDADHVPPGQSVVTEIIQSHIDAIQSALDDGSIVAPEDIDVAAILTQASDALAAGDIAAARVALSQLRGIFDQDNGNDDTDGDGESHGNDHGRGHGQGRGRGRGRG